MGNDPTWAVETNMSEAEIWEGRALAQLDRARVAEKKVKELGDRVYDLERYTALAAGSSMEEAARAFCEKQWPGDEVTNMTLQRSDATESKDPKRPGWRARCRVDGTSMKIDGHQLPGGFVGHGWL